MSLEDILKRSIKIHSLPPGFNQKVILDALADYSWEIENSKRGYTDLIVTFKSDNDKESAEMLQDGEVEGYIMKMDVDLKDLNVSEPPVKKASKISEPSFTVPDTKSFKVSEFPVNIPEITKNYRVEPPVTIPEVTKTFKVAEPSFTIPDTKTFISEPVVIPDIKSFNGSEPITFPEFKSFKVLESPITNPDIKPFKVVEPSFQIPDTKYEPPLPTLDTKSPIKKLTDIDLSQSAFGTVEQRPLLGRKTVENIQPQIPQVDNFFKNPEAIKPESRFQDIIKEEPIEENSTGLNPSSSKRTSLAPAEQKEDQEFARERYNPIPKRESISESIPKRESISESIPKRESISEQEYIPRRQSILESIPKRESTSEREDIPKIESISERENVTPFVRGNAISDLHSKLEAVNLPMRHRLEKNDRFYNSTQNEFMLVFTVVWAFIWFICSF